MDETSRLLGLHSLRILDTPPEERYDRITRMAKRMFDVEICLISLVDSQRQWFKSKQGLDACETHREISFCGHAILHDQILYVSDARMDERFADNPLVTGAPYLRFYAGCPIHAPTGQRIGTLCLIDPSPKSLSKDDLSVLRDLAGMVEDEFRLSSQITVDELTKIANRRGFNSVTKHMLALCKRTNTSADLVFFDLDNFKKINDTHGHAAGDILLKHFSRLLIKCFRDADVIARLGGDEFVVLMTGSNGSCEAALSRLADMASETECEIKQQLAWSVGRTRFDPDRHDTIEALLQDGDAQMYEDKIARHAKRR
jgi:diguanylate cyclase (GGDEF)-like protein